MYRLHPAPGELYVQSHLGKISTKGSPIEVGEPKRAPRTHLERLVGTIWEPSGHLGGVVLPSVKRACLDAQALEPQLYKDIYIYIYTRIYGRASRGLDSSWGGFAPPQLSPDLARMLQSP